MKQHAELSKRVTNEGIYRIPALQSGFGLSDSNAWQDDDHPDEKFKDASFTNRYQGVSWTADPSICPREVDTCSQEVWSQVSFPDFYTVYSISIRSREYSANQEYVKSFKILMSDDSVNWTDYNGG